MKRRDFLKLIGIAVTAPTALAAMPKKELTVAAVREFVKTADLHKYHTGDIAYESDNSYSVSVWVFTGDKWILVDKMAELNYHDSRCEVTLSKKAVRGIGAGQLVSIHYDKC